MLAALPAAPRLPVLVGAALLLVVVVVVCRRTGWTTTRRARARVLLYGATAVLLAALGWWGALVLEEGRQDALLTRVSGAEVLRDADPAQARKLLEDVLASSPSDDVRRRARLGLAAALDALEAYADAEAQYALADAEWAASVPRGALLLPWASMRIRAGRSQDALALLDAPGATEGFGTTEDGIRTRDDLRALARKALDAAPGAGGAPPR